LLMRTALIVLRERNAESAGMAEGVWAWSVLNDSQKMIKNK
jgi:hypothetical protein